MAPKEDWMQVKLPQESEVITDGALGDSGLAHVLPMMYFREQLQWHCRYTGKLDEVL